MIVGSRAAEDGGCRVYMYICICTCIYDAPRMIVGSRAAEDGGAEFTCTYAYAYAYTTRLG
jgi:hypothetical protein